MISPHLLKVTAFILTSEHRVVENHTIPDIIDYHGLGERSWWIVRCRLDPLRNQYNQSNKKKQANYNEEKIFVNPLRWDICTTGMNRSENAISDKST
jgi:hypothetical protein